MKTSAYIGGVLGIGVLVYLSVHADLAQIGRVLAAGGMPLLWLIPYRAAFFAGYALSWAVLLQAVDRRRRASLGYLFWAATVRDGVDRLLPVASIGGSVVGVRLLTWRGLPGAPAAASIIVEILLTLVALYLFTALGIVLLTQYDLAGQNYRRLVTTFVSSLPIPVIVAFLLRSGIATQLLERVAHFVVGAQGVALDVSLLDHEIRASLRRPHALLLAGSLQLLALASGAFEIWFALKLFAHPISPGVALMLESLTQAARHLAFVVPAGLGVQEAGLVVFGQATGVGADLALSVGMVKRIRELLWGVPALVSWQWQEARRLGKI